MILAEAEKGRSSMVFRRVAVWRGEK
jgi:hypothetical protein